MTRHPQIGDLLIVNNISQNQKCMGIVRKICLDNWGHQRNVYVEWSTNPPPSYAPIIGYNPEHGYCGANIHNCRREFEIVRKGKTVLG